jgi:hypothetical protein
MKLGHVIWVVGWLFFFFSLFFFFYLFLPFDSSFFFFSSNFSYKDWSCKVSRKQELTAAARQHFPTRPLLPHFLFFH